MLRFYSIYNTARPGQWTEKTTKKKSWIPREVLLQRYVLFSSTDSYNLFVFVVLSTAGWKLCSFLQLLHSEALPAMCRNCRVRFNIIGEDQSGSVRRSSTVVMNTISVLLFTPGHFLLACRKRWSFKSNEIRGTVYGFLKESVNTAVHIWGAEEESGPRATVLSTLCTWSLCLC